ncbi:MAG: TSUP family transporter [Hyphomicrobiales bacterium]
MNGGVTANLLTLESLLLLAAITAAASFVKGVTTMGLNLIGVPVIAIFFDVQTAIVATSIPKFLSDIYMGLEARDGAESSTPKGMAEFAIAGAVAVAGATFLLASLANRSLSFVLGAFVIAFVVLQLLPKPPVIPAHHRRAWGVPFGLLSGVSQGLTGAAGPTTAIYLYSVTTTTTSFVFLSSIVYVALGVMQLSAFVGFGLFSIERLMASVLLVPPVFVGTWLGIKCRRRLSVRRFRQALLVMLAATAAALIAKGI